MKKTFAYFLFSLSSFIVLTGCGHDVCVAGLGRCEEVNRAFRQQKPGGQAAGTLYVSVDKESIQLGQPAQFKATKGQAPYSYAVTNPPQAGEVDKTGKYIAPQGFPQGYGSPMDVTVTATDVNGKTGTAIITVTN